jgi:uncharacterized protein (TIGR03435 family)
MRLWMVGMVAIGAAGAQSTARPVFEVASIKVYKDEGTGPRNSRTTYGPDGIEMRARTLGFLIGEAYGFPVGRIVPGPVGKDEVTAAIRTGYDISAKAGHAVSREELRLMLQSLLADRFQLKMHRESRSALVYKLVAAKGGAKLAEADGGDLVMQGSPEGFVFRNAEVHRLCGYLSSFADRMVVDETGLEGLYNYSIKMPEDLRRNMPAKTEGKSPESAGAATFAEVLRPLGLQLVGGTSAVVYLVVDHAERPSEN